MRPAPAQNRRPGRRAPEREPCRPPGVATWTFSLSTTQLYSGQQRASALVCHRGPLRHRVATWARQSLHAEQRLRVLVADLLAVDRFQIERFQHRNGGADVARPLLLVEWTVRGEHHMVGAEEVDAADHRRAYALDRGVAVEILEIVERPLLQAFAQ